MIGCLRTRVRKQSIIALHFEFETVLKFFNLGARNEFHALLNQMHPDIVVGSETWLHSDIHNTELVPDYLGFEMFRRDR